MLSGFIRAVFVLSPSGVWAFAHMELLGKPPGCV